MSQDKRRIILDTNFLLIPGQFKVDIFQEIGKIMGESYELCIFQPTIDELTKIDSISTYKTKKLKKPS